MSDFASDLGTLWGNFNQVPVVGQAVLTLIFFTLLTLFIDALDLEHVVKAFAWIFGGIIGKIIGYGFAYMVYFAYNTFSRTLMSLNRFEFIKSNLSTVCLIVVGLTCFILVSDQLDRNK